MHRLGWPVIFLLTSVPFLIWLTMEPLSSRIGSLSTVTTSIGQLSGLIGMTLFSLSLILSSRLRLFDDLFGGINRVYIVHHSIGGTSLLLLLIHPLMLAIPYTQNSLYSAASFLFPGPDWTINLGIAGLLTVMALLILTYYVELPYEFWRFTHKFMGTAFFLGALHTFFIPSDVSRSMPLRLYMLTLAGAGLLSFIYRTLLGRFLVPRVPYQIDSVNTVASSITELTLTPTGDKHLNFHPGQFIFMTLKRPDFPDETHPFSISSAPNTEKFTVTVKALGDYSSLLATVPKGTKALIEGPYGKFFSDFHQNRNCIWIAGGIGITPFLSMARALRPQTMYIDLYYSVHSPDDAVYLQELETLAHSGIGLRLIPWYSKSQGRLTAEHIDKNSSLAGKDIYLCGPPPMMKTLKRQLRLFKIPSACIHSEEFEMFS